MITLVLVLPHSIENHALLADIYFFVYVSIEEVMKESDSFNLASFLFRNGAFNFPRRLIICCVSDF